MILYKIGESMSDATTIALIGAISTAVTSIAASYFSYRAKIAVGDVKKQTAENHEENTKKLSAIEENVNGKMEKLVNLAADSQKLAEKVIEKDRKGRATDPPQR